MEHHPEVMHLKNKIHSLYFILGTVVIVAGCFTGGFTTLEGDTLSVLDVLIQRDEWILMSNTWLEAFNAGLYGWMFLLLPCIVATPTVPLFCSQISSRYYHFIISRIGLQKYIRNTIVTAYVCAFLMVVAGLAIYAAIVGSFFPATHDFGSIDVVGLVELNHGKMIFEAGKGMVKMALIGGLFATFACMIASICQNIYIILCLPFLLNYIFQNVLLQADYILPIVLTLLVYIFGQKIWCWKYRGLAI